ncbi:hypothetical protein LSH36_406g02001 [Paralvinella palmiformis]|uniref:ribose-5-phosphate isomerase n=1 Tax=Paralvinella palmiformis TaxID=53620 RepID=A0AAD9MYR2_9ANNE|nr:hypothetical protein LSH36_406g02001 [Paralvinella palmiformis]
MSCLDIASTLLRRSLHQNTWFYRRSGEYLHDLYKINWKALLHRKCLHTMAGIEAGKRAAAFAAVDDLVKDNQVLGIGSGSTVVYAVERIDGADEVDLNIDLIKGGGGCLTQEKIVASCAKKLVIVADYRKASDKLGSSWKMGIPLEVIPLAYKPIIYRLRELLGGDPGPVVSDNGNFIVDWVFDDRKAYDWLQINNRIKLIPGVIETGLFINMATTAYFGNSDGTISIRHRPDRNGSLIN